MQSPAALVDKNLRRINAKHVFLQHDRAYSWAWFVWAMLCSAFAVYNEGHMISVFASVMVCTQAVSLLFQVFGGKIVRRPAQEQSRVICDVVSDSIVELVAYACKNVATAFVCITLVGEGSKVLGSGWMLLVVSLCVAGLSERYQRHLRGHAPVAQG